MSDERDESPVAGDATEAGGATDEADAAPTPPITKPPPADVSAVTPGDLPADVSAVTPVNAAVEPAGEPVATPTGPQSEPAAPEGETVAKPAGPAVPVREPARTPADPPTPPITKPPPADMPGATPVDAPAGPARAPASTPAEPTVTPAEPSGTPAAAPRADPPLAGAQISVPEPPVIIEPPSPDVALVGEAPRLPGEHRGGFGRLPTAPIDITPAPVHPADAEWAPTPAPPPRGLSAWALACSIIALAASLVVGWAFPIGLIGIVIGIVALRRPLESSAMAAWAIVLGTLSVLYSAGWLIYAAWVVGLIG